MYREQEKKLEGLHDILHELAKKHLTRETVHEYHLKLLDIYNDNDVRHLYSKIFGYISVMSDSNEGKDENMPSSEILLQNMSLIYNYSCFEINEEKECGIKGEDYKKCCAKIRKLYDHINLEVSRLRMMQAITERTQMYSNQIARQTDEKVSELKAEASQVAKKMTGMQREYITILGIFASIVITFVAGMSFSASALQGIDRVSIYKISFVILLLGIVLVNVLSILMSFLRDIGIENKFSHKDYSMNANIFLIALLLLLWFCSWLQALHPLN